jgi:hypothetical protein
MSKSMRLPHPLRVRSGATITTLEDAARYILGRDEGANRAGGWPRAIELTGRAIDTGKAADVAAAAEQLETSLFQSFELDTTTKKPPAPSKSRSRGRSERRRRMA